MTFDAPGAAPKKTGTSQYPLPSTPTTSLSLALVTNRAQLTTVALRTDATFAAEAAVQRQLNVDLTFEIESGTTWTFSAYEAAAAAQSGVAVAGLGAVGLTAASFGASSVTLIDSDPLALHCAMATAVLNGIRTGPVPTADGDDGELEPLAVVGHLRDRLAQPLEAVCKVAARRATVRIVAPVALHELHKVEAADAR